MSQQTTDADCRHLVEKYPDAHDAVRELIADAVSDATADSSEFSQDWIIQVISDASDICNAHGVADEDRVDLIGEAFRTAQYNKIDQAIDQFKFQIKMFQGI